MGAGRKPAALEAQDGPSTARLVAEARGLRIATEGTSSRERSDCNTREQQAGVAELDDLGEEVRLLLSEQSYSHKLGE